MKLKSYDNDPNYLSNLQSFALSSPLSVYDASIVFFLKKKLWLLLMWHFWYLTFFCVCMCVCVFILNKIHMDSMVCCCWAFSQTPMFIRFEDNVSLVPPWLYTKLFDCILISVMFSGVLKMKMNFSFIFLFISL